MRHNAGHSNAHHHECTCKSVKNVIHMLVFSSCIFINLVFFYHTKFICSEKSTKFWEIFTLDLSYVVTVKSTVEISQLIMAFSEYINFNTT